MPPRDYSEGAESQSQASTKAKTQLPLVTLRCGCDDLTGRVMP